ncbi:M28 family metallopeptidase [Bradyrhizobium liaoningense]|uniref:M28 family metallopeptidase n=1 Tax=Bradyrhizobium liaoningense TaxID=43992 RepID=UPI001BA471D6|nr:M28 family metallopeptidase [Bradyrhizobium liaoningense]MBR0820264.1 Zn-dependent exopeptidase M28 [Bradyrhizobium liaoningense]
MQLRIAREQTSSERLAVGVNGCRFGNVLVTREDDRRGAGPDGTVATAQGEFYVVVQKGRSFQRANPQAKVLVDSGRFLLIDWAEKQRWVEEPGCFAVVPYADGAIDVGLRSGRRAQPRSDIVGLVNSFTAQDLKLQVQGLSAIHTRESTGQGFLQALDICEPVLAAAGCETSRQTFTMEGSQSFNLVGRRRGTAPDARLLIMSAHLDSVNHEGGAGARAPGADDNASGCVTVMQVATALARLPELRHDVAFILFGGEEQGLFGSKHYVNNLSPEDRGRIAGVVNIDMAASKNTSKPTVLLEGAALSQEVIDQLADAAATYTQLETQVSLKPFASDHVPFICNGIPAVLTIEGADDAYPHEHTARDVPSGLDFELHRQITMMDVAWLVSNALPSPGA